MASTDRCEKDNPGLSADASAMYTAPIPMKDITHMKHAGNRVAQILSQYQTMMDAMGACETEDIKCMGSTSVR